MPCGLWANPTGGNVAAGSASIAGQGTGDVTIHQASNTAIINWQTFSIGSGELTTFLQPNAQSAALNRVLGGQTSVIDGTLSANGQIYLINGNGIVVGPGGVINAGAFTASTRDIADSDFLKGKLHFTGSNNAGVQNLGKIEALGGDVVLIGKTVDNQGTIHAAKGTAGLIAGDDVLLAQKNADGSTILVSPTTTASSASGLVGVHNSGTIAATAAELKAANGNVYALAIQNEGLIRATTVKNQGGHIWLTSDTGTVSNSGTLNASATAVKGHGGTVVVESTTGTASHSGTILARGGQGGIGGQAEISGGALVFTGLVDLTAPGGKTGTLLLDPTSLEVKTGGSGTIVSGQNNGSSTISPTTVQTALGTANVILNADNSITVTNGISWTSANMLTLSTNTSGSTITINAAISGVNGTLTINTAGVGDMITTGANGAVNVASFIMQNGYWSQNGSSLPAFSAKNFELQNTSTFLRVAGGDGSSGNPYQIFDIYGLEGIGSPGNTLLNANYIQTQNIDASGADTWYGWSGFVPIGNANNPFLGNYNGQNYTIDGLSVNRGGSTYEGLFGYVGDMNNTIHPLIENVQLTDEQVSGQYDVGGLVGWNNGGTLQDCYVAGAINGYTQLGGLVGVNVEGTIQTCASSASVTAAIGGGAIGGLAGDSGADGVLGLIANSYSTGTVSGGAVTGMGGLVGENGGTIQTSFFKGSVNASDAFIAYYGYDIGSQQVGGLVGESQGTITQCYNTGAVNGGDYSFEIGGLVGQNDRFGGNLTTSYNTGPVNGGFFVQDLGGLVGGNYGSVEICYQTGAVTSPGGGSFIGGLVGENVPGGSSLNSSYTTGSVSAGTNTFGVSQLIGSGSAGDSAVLTPTQMTQHTNYDGSWDFTNTWTTNGDTTAPQLKGVNYLTSNVTFSGTTPGSSDMVDLINNGAVLYTAQASGGTYTFTIPETVLMAGVLVTDTTGNNANTFYQNQGVGINPSTPISGINLTSQTLTVQSTSPASNGLLNNFIGGLNPATTGLDFGVNGSGKLTTSSGVGIDFLSIYQLDGSITATNANLVTAGPGQLQSNAGSITLAANTITLNGQLSSSGGVVLNSAGTINANNNTNTNGLNLSGTSITMGAIAYSGGAVTVNASGAFSVAGAFTGDSMNITAPTITLGGTLNSTNLATLNATTGAISIAGDVNAGSSNFTAAIVTLGGALSGGSETIGPVTVGATNTISIAGAINVNSLNLTGTTITLGSSLTTSGNATITTPGAITVPGAVNVGSLNFTGTNVTLDSTLTSSGDVTVNATGTIDLTGDINVGTMELTGTTMTLGGGLTASGAVNFNSSDVITEAGAVNVGGFVLQNGSWTQNSANLPSFSAGDFELQNGSYFLRVAGGNGSSAHPYLITDVYGLQGIGSPSNSLLGTSGTPIYYTQTQNIDASSTATWNSNAGFVPLGNSNTPFFGTYDGGNFTITGLTINQATNSNIGLFGDANASTLNNIGLVGGSVTGNQQVGGLVGLNDNSGTVENSYNTGTVTGSGVMFGNDALNVGGLVGQNNGGTIEGSYSTGAVAGNSVMYGNVVQNIGGLVGNNNGGTVKTSYATGDVTTDDHVQNIGGLVGNNGDGTIEMSYATGTVTVGGSASDVGGLVGENSGSLVEMSYATGAVMTNDGALALGGLVGDNNYDSTIETSYSTGTVTTGAGSLIIGGLVGNNNNSSIIETSYSTGAVTTGDSFLAVGGLAGANNGTIETCYSTSAVTVGNNGTDVGGLAGLNEGGGGGVQTSYWATDAGGLNGSLGTFAENDGYVDGYTSGVTLAQLQLQSTFQTPGTTLPGWDFTLGTGVWGVNGFTSAGQVNNGLPYFQWQYPTQAQVTTANLVLTYSGTVGTINPTAYTTTFAPGYSSLGTLLASGPTLSESGSNVDVINAGPANTIVATMTVNPGYVVEVNNGSLTYSAKTISSATLTGSVSKVYDGTTTVNLGDTGYGTLTLSTGDILPADTGVTLSSTGYVYSQKDTGTNLTVTANGLTILGNSNGDYALAGALTSVAETGAGTITARPINVASFTGSVTKTYDGTTLTGNTIATMPISSTDIVVGDASTVTLDASTYTYSQKDTGTNMTVTASGISLVGDVNNDYTLSSGVATGVLTGVGSITPKTITVGTLTGSVSKVYDGTTTLNVGNSSGYGTLAGTSNDIVAADTGVTLSASSYSYSQVDTGTSLPVTGTGLSISGDTQHDYTLSGSLTSMTGMVGAITPKPIMTATLSGYSVKYYDGTAIAPADDGHGDSLSLTTGDILPQDSGVSLTANYFYNGKDVQTDTQLSASVFSIVGDTHGDYTISNTLTADVSQAFGTIIPKYIFTTTVTGSVSKVYDGTTTIDANATGYNTLGVSSSDIVAADASTVTLTATGGYAFEGSYAGGESVKATGVTLNGDTHGDYSLQTTLAFGDVGTITPKTINSVVLSANGTVSKVYDGTTAAYGYGVLSLSSPDILPQDAQSLVLYSPSYTYSQKDPGTGLSISTNGLETAIQGGNYVLGSGVTDVTLAGVGTITAAPITVTVKAGTSVYGQNLTGILPGLTITGLQNGEAPSVLGYTNFITGSANNITSTTDAGSYKLTIGGSLTNPDYTLAGTASPAGKATTWSVTPDILTVSGLTGTSIYGQVPTAPATPYVITSSNGVTDPATLLGLINATPVTTAYTFNITDTTNVAAIDTDKITSTVKLATGVNVKDYTLKTVDQGVWTVTPDLITVAGSDLTGSSTYGFATGFVAADNFTISDEDNDANVDTFVKGANATLAATATSNAGIYVIKVAGTLNSVGGKVNGVSATDYKVVLQNGDWYINPQGVNITVANGISIYGAKPTVPVLGGTASVNGRTVVLNNTLLKYFSTDLLTTVGATGNIGVGPHTFDLTGSGTSLGAQTYLGNYYANGAVTAIWTITPATISAITVNKTAKSIYGANPIDTTLTVTGLVNGDKADGLGYTLVGTGGNLTATTNASTTPYAFTVGGGLTDANYVLKTSSLNPVGKIGKLTIGQASLVVTALSGSSILGTSPIDGNVTGDFGYSVTGFVDGDTIGSTNILTGFTETPIISGTTLKGSYTIVVKAPTVLSDPNYIAKVVSGKWSVVQ